MEEGFWGNMVVVVVFRIEIDEFLLGLLCAGNAAAAAAEKEEEDPGQIDVLSFSC